MWCKLNQTISLGPIVIRSLREFLTAELNTNAGRSDDDSYLENESSEVDTDVFLGGLPRNKSTFKRSKRRAKRSASPQSFRTISSEAREDDVDDVEDERADDDDVAWENDEWMTEENVPDDFGMGEDPTSPLRPAEHDWFQDCLLAVSCTGDVMVVSAGCRLSFIALKSNDASVGGAVAKAADSFEKDAGGGSLKSPNMTVTSSSSSSRIIRQMIVDDVIMCLICISVMGTSGGGAGGSKSTTKTGAPSSVSSVVAWTLVVAGTDAGDLLYFSGNDGMLILRQRFANAPVNSLDFSPMMHQRQQELSVLYDDGTLVSVDGLTLYAVLKAARNQVLVKGKSVQALSDLAVQQIRFQKWLLRSAGGSRVNSIDRVQYEHVSVGPTSPSSDVIDRLCSASMIDGYKADIASSIKSGGSSSTAPPFSVFATVGREPFVGFWWGSGATGPSLNLKRVARQAADYFGQTAMRGLNARFGWVGGWVGMSSSSASGEASNTPSSAEAGKFLINSPASNLPLRHSLTDLKRCGDRILLMPSPGAGMAVVTDSLARIILVDCLRGVVVRVWKGYRDAQVGWYRIPGKIDVKTKDGSKKSIDAHATYLVVYAPRRGLLEIWCMEQGPRVGAFNVSRSGTLVASQPWILGASLEDSKRIRELSTQTCFFVDPVVGAVSVLDIPFHSSMQDGSSAQQHDNLILGDVRKLLAGPLTADGELLDRLIKTIRHIKTTDALRRILLKIVDLRSLNCVMVMDKLIESLADQATCISRFGFETRRLRAQCDAYRQILNAFALIVMLRLEESPAPSEDRVGRSVTDADVKDVSQTDLNNGGALARLLRYETVPELLGCSEDEMNELMGDLADHSKALEIAGKLSTGLGEPDSPGNPDPVENPALRRVVVDFSLHDMLHCFDVSRSTTAPPLVKRQRSSITGTESPEIGHKQFVGNLSTTESMHQQQCETPEPSNDVRSRFCQLRLREDLEMGLMAQLGDFIFQPFLLEKRTPQYFISQVVPMLNMDTGTFLQLLCRVWFDDRHRPSPIFPPALFGILMTILSLNPQKQDAAVSEPEILKNSAIQTSVSRYSKIVEDEILDSCSIPEALTLALVCRGVLRRLVKLGRPSDGSGRGLDGACLGIGNENVISVNSENDGNDPNEVKGDLPKDLGFFNPKNYVDADGDPDFEVISANSERWNCIVEMLHSFLIIDIFGLHSCGAGRERLRLRDLLVRGRGALLETIAAGFVTVKLKPNVLYVELMKLDAERSTTIGCIGMELNKPAASQLDYSAGDSSDYSSDAEGLKAGYWTEVESPPPSKSSQTIASNKPPECLDSSTVQPDPLWLPDLKKLVATFPWLLSSDAVLVTCAWEAVVRWSKLPDSIDWLELAVAHVRDVANPIVQHGVAYMVWHAHVAPLFNRSVNLVEKVGRYPKDRLTRKELDLSDTSFLRFVTVCGELLQTMFMANSLYDATSPPVFATEDVLENLMSHYGQDPRLSTSGQLTLAEIAFRQKATNYGLSQHQFSVALVVRLILEYNLKSVRPFQLYDEKGRNCIFAQLYSHPLLPDNSSLDASVRGNRNRFFHCCISAAIEQLLPPPDVIAGNSSHEVGEKKSSQPPSSSSSISIHVNHVLSFEPMFALVHEWKVDPETIRLAIVITLYSYGYDLLAEQRIHSIVNKVPLASEMLMIAGERIQSLIGESPMESHGEQLATHLDSLLRTWLQSMNTERVRCIGIGRSALERLLDYVLTMLPDSAGECRIAVQLKQILDYLDFDGSV